MSAILRLFSQVLGRLSRIAIRLFWFSWRIVSKAFAHHHLRITGAISAPVSLWTRPEGWGERAIIWTTGYFVALFLIGTVYLGPSGYFVLGAWTTVYLIRLIFLWRGMRRLPTGTIWSSTFGKQWAWIIEPIPFVGLFGIEPLIGYISSVGFSALPNQSFAGFFQIIFLIATVGVTANSALDIWIHHSGAIDSTDAIHQSDRIERNISDSCSRDRDSRKASSSVKSSERPKVRVLGKSPKTIGEIFERERAAARERLLRRKESQ